MELLKVEELYQHKVVNWTMILSEIGLGVILVILAIFMLWRLFDLLKGEGVWKKELADPELDVNRTAPASVEREV